MAQGAVRTHGLSESVIREIVRICAARPEVERVLLYGSRSRGTFRPESDIDLAIDAPRMDSRSLARLEWDLDDAPIVFRIDLHRLQDLPEKIRRQVEEQGIVLFARPVEEGRPEAGRQATPSDR